MIMSIFNMFGRGARWVFWVLMILMLMSFTWLVLYGAWNTAFNQCEYVTRWVPTFCFD